jgi:hypothetical protein
LITYSANAAAVPLNCMMSIINFITCEFNTYLWIHMIKLDGHFSSSWLYQRFFRLFLNCPCIFLI